MGHCGRRLGWTSDPIFGHIGPGIACVSRCFVFAVLCIVQADFTVFGEPLTLISCAVVSRRSVAAVPRRPECIRSGRSLQFFEDDDPRPIVQDPI